MPLKKECSMDAFRANVKRLLKEYPRSDQALAIAYSTLKKACGIDPGNEKRMTPSEIIAAGKRRRKRAHEDMEVILPTAATSSQPLDGGGLRALASELYSAVYGSERVMEITVEKGIGVCKPFAQEMKLSGVSDGRYIIVFPSSQAFKDFARGMDVQPEVVRRYPL